jgi:8-oxo-dGTP pyrophosphatase MutT (NUDIX family)
MRPVYYRAAGGIVLDGQERVLLIQRWVKRAGEITFEVRLPKGHVEAGETDWEAARREVCEETGYCGTEMAADLGESSTEFVRGDEQVRRSEHYYLMRLVDPMVSHPHFDSDEAEEALFRPLWAADITDAEALLTFESEREFARRGRRWLENVHAEMRSNDARQDELP